MTDKKIQYLEFITKLAFEHDVHLASRSISIAGEINEATYSKVDAALSVLESAAVAPITIKINSGGGAAEDALAIIARMRRSSCEINTEGYGRIMSAAGIILASGNKRFMAKDARFMHHSGSIRLEGNLKTIINEAKEFKKSEETWAELMGERSNKSMNFWLISGSNQDMYLSAKQCVEYGVVDEVF